MDLKNGQIKFGTLLDNPQARAILQENFGSLLSHPMLSMTRNLTLSQIIAKGGNKLSKEAVTKTLEELRAL